METAVIFDLDGTLWDATGCACDIWMRVMEKHEAVHFKMTQETAGKLMGKTMAEIGENLFPQLSIEAREEIMNEFGEEEVKYLEENGAVLYNGVKETLDLLHREYRLYIVSNCQDGYVPAFLHAHKMERYFEDIEMSGRTGLDKGRNIKLLMERNHIKSAVYIGDTKGDEKASRYAGIPFIHVKYGFGEAEAPDAEIGSIKDLPECIKKFTQI